VGVPDESEEIGFGGWSDYTAIVRRRRWWILLPVFLCWAVVWTLGWLWPERFASEALILVQQQKVPEQYVVPNVTLDLQDRVRSMTQQILSRTRLEATINRFHLYSSRRGLNRILQTNDPVEQMRNDIQIELVQASDKLGGHSGELTAFKIRYSAPSPELAQQVNSELTSLFIDENLRSQQQLSESTTAFLSSQLADARTNLQEQEARIRDFKARHLGDLPSQVQSNVQILSGLQGQLQAAQRALDGAAQQKLYLESLQQQYESVQAALGSGDTSVTPPVTLEKELMDMRLRLADLRSKYTDDYPDIVILRDNIAKTEALKKQIEGEIASNQRANKPESGVAPVAAPTVVQSGAPTPIMQVESQLKANQLEIEDYQKAETELEAKISAYQARLNLTPETEQELADISRGYEESKANYDSLLQKQNESQLATSLEQRQQGEQFSIIDPPSLPDKPSAPNHLLVSLAGLAFGIFVGVGLAVLKELTNVRVWKEKDLEGLVQARVLVDIPELSTAGEQRLRVLRGAVEFVAAAALIVLIVAGNCYTLVKG
jgi:polysaccharide biosynthesis transport protein